MKKIKIISRRKVEISKRGQVKQITYPEEEVQEIRWKIQKFSNIRDSIFY